MLKSITCGVQKLDKFILGPTKGKFQEAEFDILRVTNDIITEYTMKTLEYDTTLKRELDEAYARYGANIAKLQADTKAKLKGIYNE